VGLADGYNVDMATVTSAPLTLEDFARLPGDGARHEMNAGELITLPPPKSAHSRLARTVFVALHDLLQKEGLREAFMEAGYVLSRAPLTIRQPYVSVLSKARIQETPEDSYFEGAPELAVEVVSPSDAAEELEIKVWQYLNAGAKQVWVIYPRSQDVHVYEAGRIAMLKGDDVLPGFAVKVSQFF